MFRAFCFISVLAALFGAGCKPSSATVSPAKSSEASRTNQHSYQVKGLVIAVDAAKKSVTIKHEDIPGYMQAMTMPFDVRDTNELAGIEPGDPVSFRMTVTDTEGWIDQIQKTGPKRNDPPQAGPFRLVRDVEPLAVGDVLPEYHFTNQLGQAFSTAEFKGGVLAINFLFTRCPYPTFCPQTARNFSTTQQALLDRSGAPTNWHMLTISFDPEFDTPPVLKRYAESYKYDPAHWTFATGALIDITAIGEQFGLLFWREEGAGISHNLRTVVLDPSGRVRKIIAGNEWKPDELVSEIVKAATPD